MAAVQHYKKINLFITITANSEWPEIKENPFEGHTTYDCPNLVSQLPSIQGQG